MNDPFQMQRELRYGAPVCDQILTGRYFTIGYSWYFRQAKWALEIVDPLLPLMDEKTKRENMFRADLRIPERFRAGLGHFKNSGYHRGHLVASANQDQIEVQNSETFLLSNMSPQKPSFNTGIWLKLEKAIRKLNEDEDTLETYVLTAPVFDFNKKVETLELEGGLGIDVPIPHSFVKSVLAERRNGALRLWTFKVPNKKCSGKLDKYLVKTYDVEQLVGGRFWDRVAGGDLHDQKRTKGKMWSLKGSRDKQAQATTYECGCPRT